MTNEEILKQVEKDEIAAREKQDRQAAEDGTCTPWQGPQEKYELASNVYEGPVFGIPRAGMMIYKIPTRMNGVQVVFKLRHPFMAWPGDHFTLEFNPDFLWARGPKGDRYSALTMDFDRGHS